MKKFVPFFLSAVMLFSSSTYADKLSSDFWAYEQVSEAYADGWLNENTNPNAPASFETINAAFTYLFNNDDPYNFQSITRAQLADILSEYYLYYDGNESIEITFPDIVSDTYAEQIQRCCNADVLNGYSDGTFKPDKIVTNAELAAIISNIKKNTDEAFDAYSAFNEKYKNLKSFTMDFNIDMDMSLKPFDMEYDEDSDTSLFYPNDENQNFKSVSSGSVKAVVNNPDTFDFEMSGDMITSVLGMEQKSNIYYKDNIYYISSDDMKVKQTMNFDDMMSQFGMISNDDFQRDAFVSGFVKKLDDGSKDIYAVFDMKSIMKDFSLSSLTKMPQMEFFFNNVYIVIHTDENDNLLGYSMCFDIHTEAENQLLNIDYDMKCDYKIRDMNSTSVDIPDSFEGYQDIEDFTLSNQGMIDLYD